MITLGGGDCSITKGQHRKVADLAGLRVLARGGKLNGASGEIPTSHKIRETWGTGAFFLLLLLRRAFFRCRVRAVGKADSRHWGPRWGRRIFSVRDTSGPVWAGRRLACR